MRMLTWSKPFARYIIYAALAALCLAAGCGKPSAPPQQFVGTWIVPLRPSGERYFSSFNSRGTFITY